MPFISLNVVILEHNEESEEFFFTFLLFYGRHGIPISFGLTNNKKVKVVQRFDENDLM